MRDWLASCRETFQPRAVDQEDIQPAVIVVIIEGDATAGGFEQVFVFVFAAVNRFRVEPRLFRDIQKADPDISTRRRFWFRGGLLQQRMGTGTEGTDERQHPVD